MEENIKSQKVVETASYISSSKTKLVKNAGKGQDYICTNPSAQTDIQHKLGAKLSGSVETGSYDSYCPADHRDMKHALGTSGALFHMIKGSLGSGILSMPLAFKHGGLWASLVGTIFVGFISTHCIYVLVQSSQLLSRRVKQPSLGYAATAEVAFLSGPLVLRKYAALVREFVEFALTITYYSGQAVYIIFIVSTLKQVVEAHYDVNLSLRVYVLLVSAIVIPIGSIKELKYLVPFSLCAIIFLMFGCGFVLYDVFSDLPPTSIRPAFTNFQKLALFYSTALFALEGIGTVFPIENVMKKPQHFLGCVGVLNAAMGLLTVLYTIMGFFGYLRYGESTQGSVTLNLGSSVSGEVVKILVALNVLSSYALCIVVPCETVWRKLGPRVPDKHKTGAYYTMRVCLIIGTLCLACAVPDLELFVGLVGALFYSTLGLLFPAVIETVTFWGNWGPLHWKLYKNMFLVLMWFIALVAGLQASVARIIEAVH